MSKSIDMIKAAIQNSCDDSEHILKFRHAFIALMSLADSELLQIKKMPDDEIKIFAQEMMEELREVFETALNITFRY